MVARSIRGSVNLSGGRSTREVSLVFAFLEKFRAVGQDYFSTAGAALGVTVTTIVFSFE